MATVETYGRLIAYSYGEIQGTPYGELGNLEYTVQRSVTGMLNAGKAYGKRAEALNSTLEQANMYQLSSVQVAFEKVSAALDALNKNLG